MTYRGETLYTVDTSGRTRFWFMEANGERYRTGYGLVGSEPTYTGWTTATPKNEGRANATDAEEQALAEIAAQYTKKRDKGFSADPDQAGKVEYIKPMLAHPFEAKRLEGQPWIAVQPKLDGIRCIITIDGARTRNGKPIFTIPHIEAALAGAFEQDPDLILDGELYNHALKADFNKISSLVKKQKPKQDDLIEAARMIEFHIYDVPSLDGDYIDRRQYLKQVAVGAGLDYLPTKFCAHPELGDLPVDLVAPEVRDFKEFIDHWHGHFMEAGYEGTMIRLPAPYQFKRTHSLLKFKDFADDEFTIVEIQEGNGNWAGYAKRVDLRLPDGRTFGAGIRGDQAFARQLLAEKDRYPGKLATVRYFHKTPDGVPRFPVVTAFDPVDR